MAVRRIWYVTSSAKFTRRKGRKTISLEYRCIGKCTRKRTCIYEIVYSKFLKTNDTLNRKIRSISTESFPALWTGCRVFVLIKLICFVLSNCPLRIGANRRGWWTRARWEYTFYIGCISAALTKNNFHHFTRKGIYLKESRVAFNGWKITREYSRKGRETFPDISPSLYFC